MINSATVRPIDRAQARAISTYGKSGRDATACNGKAVGRLSGDVGLSGSDAYTVVSGDESFSLGESATRVVTVRFRPEDEGEVEATLGITHEADNESSPLTVLAIDEGRIQLASPPGRP